MDALKNRIPILQIALLYLVVVFALYWRVLGLSFFADDLSAVWRIGVQGDLCNTSFFRPLSEFSIWKNYVFFGTEPTGYRVMNVIIHWVNATLLAILLQRTIHTENSSMRLAPVIAGLLFLCYPFHNEGVIWIVGRGAALAVLFVLAGLIIIRSSLREYVLVLGTSAAFFMGMLAYETALLFPLLALPLLWMHNADRSLLRNYTIAWSAMGAVHFGLRKWATGNIANSYGISFFDQPTTNYFSNLPKVFGRLFLPPDNNGMHMIIGTTIVAIVLIGLTYLFYRKTQGDESSRTTTFVWGTKLFIACTVPIITSISTRTSESDRFLYMPSIFLCGLIVLVVFRVFESWQRWLIVGVLLVGAECFLQQNNDNWIAASRTIGTIVTETPPMLPGSHTVISGLPGDTLGAYIFRHGYVEALLMANKDTTGLSLDTSRTEIGNSTQLRWNGSSFERIR